MTRSHWNTRVIHRPVPDRGAACQTEPVTSDLQHLLDLVVSDLHGSRRPGQQEMVELTADALSSQRTVLIQAGTGTGKSIGYLLP